jgi:hypothetical protein
MTSLLPYGLPSTGLHWKVWYVFMLFEIDKLKHCKGCAQLKRWPSVIDKAVHSLKSLSIPLNNPLSRSSMTMGDETVTASLMKSVMALKTQSQGEKILCNIQSACMEIASLLQVCSIGSVMLFTLIFVRRDRGILQSECDIHPCSSITTLLARNKALMASMSLYEQCVTELVNNALFNLWDQAYQNNAIATFYSITACVGCIAYRAYITEAFVGAAI